MLTTWSQTTQEYRDAGALCALVPWAAFLDDRVFLTKAGGVGVVLELRGVDYECLDVPQREAVTARFEAALRLWDEHTHVYQYVLKRPAPAHEEASHAHPAVDALLRRRAAHAGVGVVGAPAPDHGAAGPEGKAPDKQGQRDWKGS